MTDDDMKLPTGKTCADCANVTRCDEVIGIFAREECPPDTMHFCDWSPSRFKEQTSGKGDSPDG